MTTRFWLSVIVMLGTVLMQQAAGEEILIFSAKWCAHCVRLQNDLTQHPETLADYDWGYVNIDNERELANKYQIKTIPTLLILDDNKEVRRHTGYKTLPALRTWLRGAKQEREVSHETIFYANPDEHRLGVGERRIGRHN